MKLSATQEQALSLLPLDPQAWAEKAPERTRAALIRRGVVVVGRRRAPYSRSPAADAATVAYARTTYFPSAYRAIRAASVKYGMPMNYLDDLRYHDLNVILRQNPPVFGWILRELGTEMFLPHHGEPGSFGPLVSLIWRNNQRGEGRPAARCYFWDGSALHYHKSPETFISVLDEAQAGFRRKRGRKIALPDEDVYRFVKRSYFPDTSVPVRYERDGEQAVVRLAVPVNQTHWQVSVFRHDGGDLWLRID
jgi:hypothetical protein